MIRTIGAFPFLNVHEAMKDAKRDVQSLRSISDQLQDVTSKLEAELTNLGTMTKNNFESYDCQLLKITRNFRNGVSGLEKAVDEILQNRLKDRK